MTFDRIEGQDPAVRTLVSALERRHVHHAYRFEGPEGVGKQMAAFAFGASLVCTAGGPVGCGRCGACRRATTLSDDEPRVPLHPDVVLVARGLYPPSVLGATDGETNAIGVAQIRRVVLARAAYPPHEAGALAFIVRDADELTVQAANALLKTLEEPAPGVHFVLLTSRPDRLLDTVRSRTVPVRFGPLPETVVSRILERHGLDPTVAAIAQGSAALALALADPEASEERKAFVRGAIEAIEAPDLAAALAFAAEVDRDRRSVQQQLAHLAHAIAERAREALGKDDSVALREAFRHGVVLRTARDLEHNAQPALALEAMISRLRRA